MVQVYVFENLAEGWIRIQQVAICLKWLAYSAKYKAAPSRHIVLPNVWVPFERVEKRGFQPKYHSFDLHFAEISRIKPPMLFNHFPYRISHPKPRILWPAAPHGVTWNPKTIECTSVYNICTIEIDIQIHINIYIYPNISKQPHVVTFAYPLKLT